MLKTVGFNTLEELTASTVPAQIRLQGPLFLEPAIGESEALAALKKIMSKNVVNKSFIGMGYYETLTPTVILRNMLENPGWYTSYTPYQAEIAQGRLNSLLNFQTMVSDLTGMKMCNSSLLDESTAAAEALSMTYALGGSKREVYLVDKVPISFHFYVHLLLSDESGRPAFRMFTPRLLVSLGPVRKQRACRWRW